MYRNPVVSQRSISGGRKTFIGTSIERSFKLNLQHPSFRVQSLIQLNRGLLECSNQKRNFWTSRLSRLEKRIANEPQNAELEAAYLNELSLSEPMEVVKRYESGKYPQNAECTSQYLQAISKLKLFDRLEMKTAASPDGSGSIVIQPPSVSTLSAPSVTLDTNSKPLQVQMRSSWWEKLLQLAIFCAPVALFFLLWPDKKEGASSSDFGISNTHKQADGNSSIKFEDVKGCEETVEELKEIVEYLKNPEKFTKLGAKLPKGVLLTGLPGVGKTLLAKAVAGEADVPFLYSTGSAFDEVFVGVGSKRVRALFEDARKMAPCIIFIDEIDTLGAKRSAFSVVSREGTLNQLLSELDGFKDRDGIIIMAATNFPESLDSALTRPGRFDRQIYVNPPDIKGRKDIIDLYLTKTRVDNEVNSTFLARGSPGFTGADIQNWINTAAIKAASRGLDHIDMKLLEEAKDDVVMGIKKKNFDISEENRKITAYHEGGHALVALKTEGALPVHKATVVPRGQALGMVLQVPDKEEISVTKKQLNARLAGLLGGRAAEEIIFGEEEITSGASSDFQQATKLAYSMISKWGMNDNIGTLYLDKENMSEKQREMIDLEVQNLLKRQYDTAKKVLKENEKSLHSLANALLEHETLTGEEIKQIINGQTLKKKTL